LLTKFSSVTTKHHRLKDSTGEGHSLVTLVIQSLPVAILRTSRLVNAEAAPILQAKTAQLLGAQYVLDVPSPDENANGISRRARGRPTTVILCYLRSPIFTHRKLRTMLERLECYYPTEVAGEREPSFMKFFQRCIKLHSLTSKLSQVVIRTGPDLVHVATTDNWLGNITATINALQLPCNTYIYFNSPVDDQTKRLLVEQFQLEDGKYLDADTWDASWEEGEKL
jgi:hypothetical protein